MWELFVRVRDAGEAILTWDEVKHATETNLFHFGLPRNDGMFDTTLSAQGRQYAQHLAERQTEKSEEDERHRKTHRLSVFALVIAGLSLLASVAAVLVAAFK